MIFLSNRPFSGSMYIFWGGKKGMQCQEFRCGRFLFRMPVANEGLGWDIPKPKTCSNFM